MPLPRARPASRAKNTRNDSPCLRLQDFSKNYEPGYSSIMRNIIDTGPLVYRFDAADSAVARWARKLFAENPPPFFTCEAVLVEAAYMASPELIARMVKDGDLVVSFALQDEIERVHQLL